MKKVSALVAAFLVTACVGLGMLAIGWNAFTQQSVGVPVNTGDPAVFTTSGTTEQQIQQLQAQVKQDAAREQALQAQLDTTNQQLSQYQQVISELQQSGLIRITADGQIQLGRRGNSFPSQGN